MQAMPNQYGFGMHDRDGFIWFDGEWVPWRSAKTHVLTHSLHYGLSVLEGVRAYRTRAGTTAIFRSHEHVRRFVGSAHAFRMRLPFGAEAIARALLEVVTKNELEEAYLRPLAFFGSEKLGVSPVGASVHVVVAAWPWKDYFDPSVFSRGLRVKTSSFARQPPGVTLPRAKVAASYTNAILAKLEASEDGYDEALMLDTAGFVAEGPGENLFVVRDGELFEPEPTSALVGVTRDSIVALARDRGLRVSERRLTRDDVYLADEAFFTGTAVEVVPIVELDRRQIGDGKPGPITRRLRDAYARAVRGEDPLHTSWLCEVPGSAAQSLPTPAA